MKFVSNAGTDRVLDLIRPWLKPEHRLDMVSPSFSLFAFAEVLSELPRLSDARLVVPPCAKAPAKGSEQEQLGLLGNVADRAARNKLQAPWLAKRLAAWLESKADVRHSSGPIDEMDEERIVKSATGIRNTVVWKKLYKFQRDGVVGAIDKLAALAAASLPTAWAWARPSRPWPSSSTTSCATTACWCWPQASARQLDALQGQRQAQRPGRRPLQLRRPEPHRPVARRRHLRRHRPVPRELGQLRPGGHRRVAQLPQQGDHKGKRDPLRPLMRKIIRKGSRPAC
jgi:hypothetical protein